MRIKKDKEWKIAFRIRYGLFKYLVILFGLHGTPATFQHFINNILSEHLNIFVSAYIDDLLIYSNSLREHKEHIYKILGILRENRLQVDIKKYKFYVKEVLYLRIIINRHGIKMDPAKVTTIKN